MPSKLADSIERVGWRLPAEFVDAALVERRLTRTDYGMENIVIRTREHYPSPHGCMVFKNGIISNQKSNQLKFIKAL